MQVQPVAFTGSGLIGTAGYSATITSPEPYNKPFLPTYLGGTDSIATPAEAQRVVGFAFQGFTKVVLHNGIDNTGDVVAVATGAGTLSWSYEVNCQKGLYVETTGTGSGTVWLV